MVPSAKFGDLNKDKSTIGCFSVSSQISQARKPTAAMAASTQMTGELNQSASLPVSNITCSAPTQISSSAKPVVSTGSFRVGVSRPLSPRQHRKKQAAPTGRLMRKIHSQEKLSEM